MKVIKEFHSYQVSNGVYTISTNSAQLKLIFMSDEVFRIRTNFNNDWNEASYILVRTAWDDHCDDYMSKERVRIAPIEPKIEESPETLTFKTSAIRVIINKEKFAVEVYDNDGFLLHSDIASRAFVQDHLGRVYHYSGYNEKNDKFYGFGEHNGTLEKSLQRLRLSPKDALGHNPNTGSPMYKHIPFYIKNNPSNGKSIGMYYHNTYDCSFDMGAEVSGYWPRYTYYTADGGEIDWFFIYGKNMGEVVQHYTELTGKTILPPKYSLGYLGSTMYYVELPKDCDKEIVNFIDKNFAEGIPVDGFQLSSGYTVGKDGKRYFFTWNDTRFPDRKRFFDDMIKRGVMCSPNIKPGILLTHPLYSTWSDVNGFILNPESNAPYIDAWWGGDASFVDFTSAAGRRIWKKHMTESLIVNGVTSIWNDNCEYEINDHDARCSLEGKGGTAGELKNVQSLLMNKISHEALAEYGANERPFVVCRSGCAGIQRYASTWAGDNTTHWDTITTDIATILNMGLSGVAHSGCDVGGFHGSHPEEELLIRWVQAGIFFPRFSIHSCNDDNTVTEPWMYKKALPLIKEAIKLRYSLLPYLYSLMNDASERGTPIMRPLCYDFPSDTVASGEWGAFMIGSSLLVAPITEKSVTEKSIYLPAGCDWFDYYTRERYSGGQRITIPVTMASIPLFIRDNAFIPRNYEVFSIRKDRENYWDIVITATKNTNYTIYEDDGITNNYRSGEYLKTKFAVTAGEKVIIKVSNEGKYKSNVKNIVLDVINVEKGPYYVVVGKEEVPQYLDESVWNEKEIGWRYDADLKSARIKYPKPANEYEITVSFEPFDLIGMAISENANA